VRRKSNHFGLRRGGEEVFGKLIDVDPWMLNPYFRQVRPGQLPGTCGRGCLATTSTLLAKIRKKYKEYGIKEKPFVIVKADAGTYGMGIMTVRDASESRT
jgi:glutamate--cysteine ligase